MEKARLHRPRTWKRLEPWIGSNLIKVVTGQRRVGKSSFLSTIADVLETKSGTAPLFVQCELAEWSHIATGDDLLRAALAYAPSGQAVLLVDEVQEISGFDKALRSLVAEERWDVYVTGSNAELLSGEIASRFAGRAVTIEMHPLGYDEFLVFHDQVDSDASLARYLRYGGLPFLRHLPLRDDTAFEYLGGVAQTAILKDVVRRHSIRSPDLLERLVLFLADSTGSPVSAQSIARYLKSQRATVSVPTLLEYMHHLQQAYLLRRVRRQDLEGKRFLEVAEKHYFEDVGIRAALLGSRPQDIGKILENVVYQRLLMDGWSVSTGDQDGREIDFVCERGSDRIYVQATYLLADTATRQREFGNLLAIADNHPKFVVSMDPHLQDDRGVKHQGLRTFLRDGIS